MDQLKDIGWLLGPMVSMVAAAIVGWIAWSIRTRFVTHEDLNAARADLGRIVSEESTERRKAEAQASDERRMSAHRLTEIEAEIRHLPTAEDVAEIKAAIGDMGKSLARVEAQMDGMDRLSTRLTRQVDVMDDFLRKVKT